jgi:hypothetical protein
VITDEQRGAALMKGTPHCCPICCKTLTTSSGRHKIQHAPLWLTIDNEWYCPRPHGTQGDDD